MSPIQPTLRDEIVDLINLYALAIDTKSWGWFDRVFTPNVVADFPGRRWIGLQQWTSDFAGFHEPFAATQHQMNVMRVTMRDNGLDVLTYGSWLLAPTLDGDRSTHLRGQGWYEDRVVQTPDGWRISARTCRMIATEGPHADPGVYTSSLADAYAAGEIRALR